MTITRIDQNGRRSRAVVHQGTIYFAGQVGDDWTCGAAEQAAQALARVDRILAELGSDRSKVLSATIWLKSMQDYDAVNAVWDQWIDRNACPARAAGVVEMADPNILVEFILIAAQ
ncbi:MULTISPECIES: RidA family protein [Hyphomicrobiales]|uniref:Cytochrome C2 n=2 Tax=Prosthecodimorpha TaxID=2981530 RepID=A0A0P6WEY1_9HYPH|nr:MULTISPECIES: RidA family protein [Hyphomicrobiales]KPL54972.1 hypothetical protein ABB55_24360 [Prosthecomicrobium hirschii]MBT9290008.1 RidA family protein [Prosthecodimorpha staleyi]MCW1840114.1 RidA family protein [Prosthecomicrobium hirschii]